MFVFFSCLLAWVTVLIVVRALLSINSFVVMIPDWFYDSSGVIGQGVYVCNTGNGLYVVDMQEIMTHTSCTAHMYWV